MPTRPDMNTRVDAPVDPRVAWRMTLHQALQLVLNENDNQWMTVRGPEESRNARYQLGTNFSAVCLSSGLGRRTRSTQARWLRKGRTRSVPGLA